jgi:glycosyltransferase involved in cell wall biosynthesis
MLNVSVVVCVKNEASRIEACLLSILQNPPQELIVVDGNSTDNTVAIAKKYTEKVIVSDKGSLCADRQVGIDLATSDKVVMIDADHRIKPDTIQTLLDDMTSLQLDIVQSQLRMHEINGFWDKAEDQMWQLNHNHPGVRNMIGTAPAIFNRQVFEQIRFDANITATIDDTDFIYRLKRDTQFQIGIGNAVVYQSHFASYNEYKKKFIWYGTGDGEFCIKHPKRAPSMLFHIMVRYPFIYSLKALFSGFPHAALFFVFQGVLRTFGAFAYFLRRGD